MTIFTTFSRILAVAIMISLSSMAKGDVAEDRAKWCIKYARPASVTLASITGCKPLVGAIGYGTSEVAKNIQKNGFMLEDELKEQKKDKIVFARAAGYIFVNGSLRLAVDKYSLNEEYIDKKCDEYLHEDIAWLVKPVAKIVVDLAYDYITVELLRIFVDAVNEKDENARKDSSTNLKLALHLRRE